jgi:hypothetical protein
MSDTPLTYGDVPGSVASAEVTQQMAQTVQAGIPAVGTGSALEKTLGPILNWIQARGAGRRRSAILRTQQIRKALRGSPICIRARATVPRPSRAFWDPLGA